MVGPSQKISKSSQSRHSERSKASVSSGKHTSVPQPDPEQIKQALNSPEGQALLKLLQADGGAGVQTASAALRGGDTEGAMAALSKLLAGTDAEDLAKRMGEQL